MLRVMKATQYASFVMQGSPHCSKYGLLGLLRLNTESGNPHTVRWVATQFLVSLFVQHVLFELYVCMVCFSM